MNRRKFLKYTTLTAVSSLIIPPFLRGNSYKDKSVNKPEPGKWKDSNIDIAWIGHSTVLINFYGKIILTDPVLFDRVGLYLFGFNYGPQRFTPPALTINEIPRPDLILLSHAHLDHMDYKTLINITDMYPGEIECITAYNTSDVINDLEWKSLKEIDWREEISIHDITIKAIEVKHFGWRYPWERDRSAGYFHNGRSFNAYVMKKNNKKILFGGDTAFTDKFKESKEKVDIAIMPIGAYYPWRRNHCNPDEALQMAKDLDAKIFIPIHTNTFKQGMEPKDEPLNWLRKSYSSYNIELGIQNIGETYTTS